MTLTPRDFAFDSMAAPEPESRFVSSSTFAPLVMACSACCCCADLSPCAFWISTGTPRSSKAFCRSGRSAFSQRSEDFVSGSRTATFCASPPPPPPPPLDDESSSSPPQPANTAIPIARALSANAVLLIPCHLSSSKLFSSETDLPANCRGEPVASPPSGRREAVGQCPVGPAEHEDERAEELSALPQLSGDDADVVRGRRDRVARDRFAKWIEQQRAGLRQLAADDEQLGVELVAEGRRRDADEARCVGDHALAGRVAAARQLDEPVDRQRVAVLAAEQVQEGVGARVRLQASPVAAPAERAVLVDEHVPDLPGGPP